MQIYRPHHVLGYIMECGKDVVISERVKFQNHRVSSIDMDPTVRDSGVAGAHCR